MYRNILRNEKDPVERKKKLRVLSFKIQDSTRKALGKGSDSDSDSDTDSDSDSDSDSDPDTEKAPEIMLEGRQHGEGRKTDHHRCGLREGIVTSGAFDGTLTGGNDYDALITAVTRVKDNEDSVDSNDPFWMSAGVIPTVVKRHTGRDILDRELDVRNVLKTLKRGVGSDEHFKYMYITAMFESLALAMTLYDKCRKISLKNDTKYPEWNALCLYLAHVFENAIHSGLHDPHVESKEEEDERIALVQRIKASIKEQEEREEKARERQEGVVAKVTKRSTDEPKFKRTFTLPDSIKERIRRGWNVEKKKKPMGVVGPPPVFTISVEDEDLMYGFKILRDFADTMGKEVAELDEEVKKFKRKYVGDPTTKDDIVKSMIVKSEAEIIRLLLDYGNNVSVLFNEWEGTLSDALPDGYEKVWSQLKEMIDNTINIQLEKIVQGYNQLVAVELVSKLPVGAVALSGIEKRMAAYLEGILSRMDTSIKRIEKLEDKRDVSVGLEELGKNSIASYDKGLRDAMDGQFDDLIKWVSAGKDNRAREDYFDMMFELSELEYKHQSKARKAIQDKLPMSGETVFVGDVKNPEEEEEEGELVEEVRGVEDEAVVVVTD